MPLTMAGIGETNTISRIGGNEETRRFLANLGFVAGAFFALKGQRCDLHMLTGICRRLGLPTNVSICRTF